jgi:diadenosine tetraphosphate (Ap4A) HIT family hydrolase
MTTETKECPFCARIQLDPEPYNIATVAVLEDKYPVAEGHRLVVPIRHVGRFQDLTPKELREMFYLAQDTVLALNKLYGPEAYTIGMNDGAAAGQTVPHLHLHIIPRNLGDTPSPKYGIRNVIPSKAAY